MKRTAIATLALLASAASAWAANGLEFIGAINIQTVTAACTSAHETSVNSIYRFRYNPPGLGGTYTGTRFSLFEEGGAQNYDRAPGSTIIGTGFKAVAGTSVDRQGFTWLNSTMRFTKQTPATLALTTKTVSFVGDITNFDWVNGCTVHFTGAGVFHS